MNNIILTSKVILYTNIMAKFFKAIGRGIKKAASSVGKFVKDNSSKINEFAKKHKIASKVAGRISPKLGLSLAAAGYRRGRKTRSGRKGYMIPTALARRGMRRVKR